MYSNNRVSIWPYIILVPYTLREFGELGVGEKHCILPNNVLTIPQKPSTDDNPDEKNEESKEAIQDNGTSVKEFRKMGNR